MPDRRLVLAAVFLASAILLGFGLNGIGLAENYVDPVAKIPAQDEAVYSSTALHMAESGGWLTPMFLGRYALYKPPLLYWAAGASAMLFGPSAWALRLPSVVAAALVAVILFAWIWQSYSITAAIAAWLLLIFDRIFFELSRLVLTDMLLLLMIVVAIRSRWWIAGLATGLAIMTKGVAGFIPLMILIGSGIGWREFIRVCGVAALIAAPWHAYQLAVHTRWFWTEYILTEHFTWALAAPEQSTQEGAFPYYLKRLAFTDPLLCLAAAIGIPVAIRRRNRLAAAWIGAVLLTLIAFGYRNTSYLLPLIPALCLLAAGIASRPLIVLAALRILLLPYGPEHPIGSVAALKAYAAQHRANDLILIAPDDEFVSSTLNLRHVRYVFFDPYPDRPPLPLDFRYLGITVTVPQFNGLAALEPVYEQRLSAFGLPSPAPIATVITARSPEELKPLIASNPNADFWLPLDFSQYSDGRHIAWNATSNRVFLLGR